MIVNWKVPLSLVKKIGMQVSLLRYPLLSKRNLIHTLLLYVAILTTKTLPMALFRLISLTHTILMEQLFMSPLNRRCGKVAPLLAARTPFTLQGLLYLQKYPSLVPLLPACAILTLKPILIRKELVPLQNMATRRAG